MLDGKYGEFKLVMVRVVGLTAVGLFACRDGYKSIILKYHLEFALLALLSRMDEDMAPQIHRCMFFSLACICGQCKRADRLLYLDIKTGRLLPLVGIAAVFNIVGCL